MMDILDRLEKLENLVRHDDEARQVCADARQEILKLRSVGNAGAIASAASSGSGGGTSYSWYRPVTLGGPPPPSQTTQVKMDTTDYTRVLKNAAALRMSRNSYSPTEYDALAPWKKLFRSE